MHSVLCGIKLKIGDMNDVRNILLRINNTVLFRYFKWILSIVLILYANLELIDYGTKMCYTFQGTQWYPAKIERITGIRIQHFELISHYMNRLCIEHDSIAFYTLPSNDMFDKIDKRIAAGDTCWQRSGSLYTFHLWWDKESSPPKGEKYHTGDFSIKITKGNKVGKIIYWDLERFHKQYHLDEKNN